MEEACHWGQTVRFQKTFGLALPASCLRISTEALSCSCLPAFALPSWILNTLKPNASFCKLSRSQCLSQQWKVERASLPSGHSAACSHCCPPPWKCLHVLNSVKIVGRGPGAIPLLTTVPLSLAHTPQRIRVCLLCSPWISDTAVKC